MKPIIIKESNKERIEEMLEDEQHRCSARLIGYSQIEEILQNVQKRLGITKKALEGTTADVDYHAQTFPNAYQYTPNSTQFSAVFEKGSWRLAWVCRAETRRGGHKVKLTLSESAKEAVLCNASNPF